MNVVTSTKTYATVENAKKALEKALHAAGLTLDQARWLIAVSPNGRFVPTLVGVAYVQFAHYGIMVIG